MQLVHVSRWNRSHVSVRVRLVRAASSHNTAESRLTSNGKKNLQFDAHNYFVFYSCNRELLINLAHDATVGERCRKLKFFLRFHQDPSMSSSNNESCEREIASTYHFVDRERKRSTNGDEVVVHTVIQITGDPIIESTAPPRSTHVRSA